MTVRLLFVTWDGPQVSYVESLFGPIFGGLRAHGVETDILQFRWGDPVATAAVAACCSDLGIGYTAVPLARRFGGPGAMMAALAGARDVRAAIGASRPDIIMPRSHMPALAVLAARPSRRIPILFDADGLPADERVDFGGLSRRSLTYRLLAGIEMAMLRRSAGAIVRSTAAADILAKRADIARSRFTVVANGRDERLFGPGSEAERLETRAHLGIDRDAPLLAYAGSVGAQYCFERIARTAAALRRLRPDARLLVLTGSVDEAHTALASEDPSVLAMTIIRSARPEAVPSFLAAADVGLAFRKRSFSTQAIAPIKLGEYLLCGLPVIGTAGIGETQAAVAARVFLDDEQSADEAARWTVDHVIAARDRYRASARAVGLANFSLRRSVEDYAAAIAGVGAIDRNSSINRGA
jgi:hypothetical protein